MVPRIGFGHAQMNRFGKGNGREVAMSISLALTVLSVSAGNDGTRMERTRYQTGVPLQGDLGSIFMISSVYGPFQSLTKYLNLLNWRCETFEAISFGCS